MSVAMYLNDKAAFEALCRDTFNAHQDSVARKNGTVHYARWDDVAPYFRTNHVNIVRTVLEHLSPAQETQVSLFGDDVARFCRRGKPVES